MPADKKVSIGWQVVFTFMPIVNFWAFYRIRRLRKYELYIGVPEVVVLAFLMFYVFGGEGGLFLNDITNSPAFATPFDAPAIFNQTDSYNWLAYLLAQIAGWGLHGFSIYLIIIWSRQYNLRYQ